MKRLKNLLVLSIIPILLISMVFVTPVLADAPVVYSYPLDETGPLQNPCGFEISVHTYGTWEWREFYNQTGQLVRVQAMWSQARQTWSANGKSLAVMINASGHATLAPDLTSYVVTWAGPGLFITVPGYGHVYGSTGNNTSQYSWPDFWTFIRTIRNVGNPFIENWGPICAYLAP
jgi:hypothetical protein